MIESEPLPESEVIKVNYRSRYVVQPILITLMVSAAAGAFLSAIAVGSTMPWLAIIFPVFAMVLEGIFTAIWMSKPEQRLLNKPLYRGAEILLIIIVLRVYTWALIGNWPEAGSLIGYLRDPLSIFGDPFFILALVLVLISWSWAISVADSFQKMALDPTELRFYDRPVRDRPQVERPNTPFRTLHFEQIGRQWLIGAGVMALLAAVSTVDTTNFDAINWRTVNRLPLPAGVLLSLLVYFGTGFALISQGRLAIMNARWLFGNAEKTAAVERSWNRQTLWLLLIIGGFAAFLPIGSTVLIGRLIELVIFAIYRLIGFLISIVVLFLSLFASDEQAAEEVDLELIQPEPPAMPELPPALPPGEPGFPIIGTRFWIIAIVVAGMAVIFFLRDRGIKLPKLNWSKIKSGFANWWQSLWKIVVEQAQDFRDAMLTRLVREEFDTDRNQPWRFIRLNSLSPEQKLRYFYLSTVQRTEKGSLRKKGSDTPLEYAAELKQQLPDASQAIDVVTNGFLQARYANGDISTADVERVEPEWKSLRSTIKRIRSEA